MHKSKFIDIVRTFSRDELKRFKDFVNSPYHNSNKNVIKIYDIIRKLAPEFGSAILEKENLFRAIYPGKKYNDTVMRILSSDLLSLAEEFLILNRSGKFPFGNSLTLLEELRDRGLDSLYQKNFNSMRSKLDNIDDTRTRYFSEFEMEIVNVDYYLRKEKQQLICENVLLRGEKLIYFTLIEITRHVHDLIINERTFNAKFEINIVYDFVKSLDFKYLIEKIKQGRPEHYPIISIYHNLLMALLDEENDSVYNKLKESVESHLEKMSSGEIHHLLNNLESCCLNRMKFNTQKYRNEIFHVYELMLGSGTYSIVGTTDISVQRFKNILIGGINLNKLEWIEKFVNEYIGRVQPEFRESMQFYSYALLSFQRNDFSNSLENIMKVKYEYFTLKMDVKSWMLKIFYELKYYEQALSFIDSYRHFLSKNKSLSEHFKERHLYFLKYTGELLKMSSQSGKPGKLKLSEIRHIIGNTGNVVHKEWLIEKLNELE